MVLTDKLVRIFLEVKQLCLADSAVHHVILYQLPVAAPHAAHSRLGAAAVHTKKRIANRLCTSH